MRCANAHQVRRTGPIKAKYSRLRKENRTRTHQGLVTCGRSGKVCRSKEDRPPPVGAVSTGGVHEADRRSRRLQVRPFRKGRCRERSEERRVGQEWVSTGGYSGWPAN